jgi:predicted metal-dependent hydrolase
MPEFIEILNSENTDIKTTILIIRSKRAKQLRLRIDPYDGIPKISAPPNLSMMTIKRFAQEKIAWITAELDALPPRKGLANDSCIPILGVDHTILHCPEARRGVWCQGKTICVSGQAEYLERRVQDWLKLKANKIITPIAMDYARVIKKKISGITIKNTKSRWGSCSNTGRISFTWQLIMTPEQVMKYVIAHEVCHLEEFNHSEAFWRLVERIFGKYESEKDWLKKNGPTLYRYGNSLKK